MARLLLYFSLHFPESVSLPERNKSHPVRISSPLKFILVRIWFQCRYTIGITRGTEPYYPLQVSCIASFRKLKASLWAAITYSMENTSVGPLVFQGHLAAYDNLHHSAFAAAGWDIHTAVSLE